MKTSNQYNEEWNKLFLANISKGADHVNNTMAYYCESIILKAKEAYYSGSPFMEDSIYDDFESKLKILRPESKVLTKVGA